MPDFLPEYAQASIGAHYIGMYRLFTNQKWQAVCDPSTKKAARYSSAIEAVAAAKEYVRAKLNPVIRSETKEPERDVLGLKDWLRDRQTEHATAKLIGKTKRFKPVVVEHKKRGRLHGKASV